MTKSQFIKAINTFHKEGKEQKSINFLRDVTRMSERLCRDIIRSIWGCSDPKHVGTNLYSLMEVSSQDKTFEPKLKKDCPSIYFMYLDEHTAAFALHKIKDYTLTDYWFKVN